MSTASQSVCLLAPLHTGITTYGRYLHRMCQSSEAHPTIYWAVSTTKGDFQDEPTATNVRTASLSP